MTNNNNLSSKQVADARNDLDFLRKKTQKNNVGWVETRNPLPTLLRKYLRRSAIETN